MIRRTAHAARWCSAVDGRRDVDNRGRTSLVALTIALSVVAPLVLVLGETSGRKRFDADQQGIAEIRAAIARYSKEYGRVPRDKNETEAFLEQPPVWRCTGQEWIYQSESGGARLLVTDAHTCSGRRR